MKTKSTLVLATLSLLSIFNFPPSALAQGSLFTYQGRLAEGTTPANGNYDVQFRPFGSLFGGTQLANPALRFVSVSNGLFTTTMDFGPGIFDGNPVYLQLEVRTNGAQFYNILTPRQQITPAPYAIFAGGVTLTNGAVDTPQLAAGAVTAFKLASNSVTSAKIADGAVDTAQLAGGAVTAFKLASNSVTSAKIADGAVDTPQLAGGAVTSAKVADGTLLPADLNLGNFGTTFWKVGGNTGTSADFIGTTDDQPFDIRVNNVRAMRFRLTMDPTQPYTNSPNIVGGSPVNGANLTVVGATIGGGGGSYTNGTSYPNQVTGSFGTVAGGLDNRASELIGTVGGGQGNTAGNSATVPGGFNNTASGAGSFAAGTDAKAIHSGSFVWSDNAGYNSGFNFSSTTVRQFAVRATGGFRFVTAIDGTGAATAGVRLLAGDSSWSSISDRNAKKNFTPVNAEAVLEKLAAMPVQSWNYKWESDTNTPHLGPMAQDFKAAFYPGRDDKSISTLEFDGVELAAIQGLNERIKQKDARVAALEKSVAELKEIVAKLAEKR